jgi:cytochrome c553
MIQESGPFRRANPWPRIAWTSLVVVVCITAFLGFFVLGRYQQGEPALNVWAAICRSVGISADTGPARQPRPPLRTPTLIAWTGDTLNQIRAGNPEHGAFIALNCAACHGEDGISSSNLAPTLAGMDPNVIYKQLADYRSGKRLSGVMDAMGKTLSARDLADVAAYFSRRPGGLSPVTGVRTSEPGRSLRVSDPATRLVFAGDPARGIAPCSSCHGPGGYKLGAPTLQGQRAAYIERQLGAFAQGLRQNDIGEQMRTIAKELTPEEMHAVARLYAADGRKMYLRHCSRRTACSGWGSRSAR